MSRACITATKSVRPNVLSVRPGRDGQFYWHIKAANGKVVADGSEGYANKGNARRAARRFIAVPLVLEE